MTPTTDVTDKTVVIADNSLIEQSQALRQQLREQRKRIKKQLDPVPHMNTGYPRSMTMRFLTQRKALVAGLVTEVATLVLGARLLKSVAVALSVARIVRSSAGRDKNQVPPS